MAERLVIIGGDAGGMGAASQARRRRGDLEIVALERGTRTSFSACGIPHHVAGILDDLDDLVVRTPQEHRDQHRIDVRLRQEATGIDLAERSVEVRDHEHHRTYTLGFDQLCVGTGARPRRPPIPGIDADHVVGVQNLDDAEALLDRAHRIRCQDVVVVGGGYIGLEMAEAFVRWGAKVTVVDAASEIMHTLDPDMAALVREAMGHHDIEVLTDVEVLGIEADHVALGDRTLPADLVILGMGVTPNSELAGAAGVDLGPSDAIAVDRRQRTSADGVWAAGDCATSFHLLRQEPVHIALGTVANRQGRVAGVNIGGGYATFPGVLGTAVTKLCGTEIGRTGLTAAEADDAGFGHIVACVDGSTRAAYFPGATGVRVKVLAEQKTGRLLGGQIVGGDGAAKRIDTLATAITAGFTVHDMIDLDLGYAPPLSPVWDPVVIACRVASREF